MSVIAWTIASAVSSARVYQVSLEELSRQSALIVRAHVTAVEGLPHGQWRAEASVDEVWKGTSVSSVGYRASSDLACDTSFAKVGEEVILFLTPNESTVLAPYMQIAADGRGRMPIQGSEGLRVVSVSSGVTLPQQIKPLTSAHSNLGTPALVDIETLRSYVQVLNRPAPEKK